MGIFDIFSTSDQQAAADTEQRYLQQGYSQLSDLFGQGRNALTNYGGAGVNSLYQQYGAGQGSLNQNFAPAIGTLNTQYQAVAPGQTQLANLLGFGPGGSAGISSTLENLPGYQFALNQGAQNVMRNQAATGQLGSGATLNALQNQGQGQAQQNYANYVAMLQPYLGATQNAANAAAGSQMGLGTALNANQTGLGNTLNANLLTQGGGLNQNYMTQGNAAYGTQAAIGNAQAQANLAGLTQSGNIIGALGGLGALLLSDERAKEGIEPVGQTYDGQTIHRFNYKGDPTTRMGLLAQDVEQRSPQSVATLPGGLKAVNYRGATDYAAALGARAGARAAPPRGGLKAVNYRGATGGARGQGRGGRPDYAAMLTAGRAA